MTNSFFLPYITIRLTSHTNHCFLYFLMIPFLNFNVIQWVCTWPVACNVTELSFFIFKIINVGDCLYCRHVKRDRPFFSVLVVFFSVCKLYLRTLDCVCFLVKYANTDFYIIMFFFCKPRPAFNLQVSKLWEFWFYYIYLFYEFF